ncbi:hypothetical protein [Plantactinospora siamensis]|uniref:hypothetical protein n=1 Tax=Plantactinospora siamensis TaxID=555372 RepID=UPI003671B29E
MDERGRVLDVRLEPRWAERIGPGDLGASIFEAYRAAELQAAVAVYNTATAAAPREAQPDLRELARDAADRPRMSLAEWFGATEYQLAETTAELERLERFKPPAEPGERTQLGPRGLVGAVLAGRQVSGVTVRLGRGPRPSAVDLARDAQLALQSAGRNEGGPDGRR